MPKSDEGELSELTAEQSDEAEHLRMGSHRAANVQLWLHNPALLVRMFLLIGSLRLATILDLPSIVIATHWLCSL